MIDFLTSTPGLIVTFCVAFPFLAIVIGLVLASVGYVLALKLSMALEDVQSTRNRKL